MKTLCRILLVLFIIAFCVSCKKNESSDNNNTNGQNDFYYVRFEAHNQALNNSKIKVNLSLSGCQSIQREGVGTSLTEILGPANKNAEASISASGAAVRAVRIYVSKNNGPFAFQSEGTYRTSCILDF